MTKLSMTRDINGFNTFGLVPSEDKFNTTLAATVAQTFTVPAKFVNASAIFFIEPGATVWVAHNETATLPGGSVASTVSEGNPTVWTVSGRDTISMICNNTTAEVGIKFYEL